MGLRVGFGGFRGFRGAAGAAGVGNSGGDDRGDDDMTGIPAEKSRSELLVTFRN